MIKMPIFGQMIEKNIVARTTRTLGTLVASGVPILEALNITRETSGNAMFEHMYLQDLRVDSRGRVDCQADEGVFSQPKFDAVCAVLLVHVRRPVRSA